MAKKTYMLKSRNINYKIEVKETDGNYIVTGARQTTTGKASKLEPFKGNITKKGDYYVIRGENYNSYAIVEKDGNNTWVSGPGICASFESSTSSDDHVRKKEFEPIITAPITGKAIKLNVNENSRLKKDDVILIIEAMKMEFQIKAGHSCRVKKIMVKPGQLIEQGAPLVELQK